MNDTSYPTTQAVAPEEIERRIEEYRRLGWERRAPAHVVYHDKDQPCPWSECDAQISGINFQLEKMGDDAFFHERLLSAWWRGAGLVGRCPRCGQFVLFGLQGKQKVADISAWEDALLPDDWHQKAYLIMKPTR